MEKLKWYRNSWFYIWLAFLLLFVGMGVSIDQSAYNSGYEQGYSDTPYNVVEIDKISLSTDNDTIRVEIISGNTTFTAVEMPTDKPISEWTYEP